MPPVFKVAKERTSKKSRGATDMSSDVCWRETERASTRAHAYLRDTRTWPHTCMRHTRETCARR